MQPFLALGKELARAGHEVTLVVSDPTHRDYRAAARRAGISLIPIAGSAAPAPDRFSELGRDVIATSNPLVQLKKILDCWYFPLVPLMFDAATALCQQNDVVIGHMALHPLRVAAEQAGVPMATITLAPGGTPSACTRPFGAPNLGRWANPYWWKLARYRVNRALLPSFNALRRSQGLAPHQDLLTQTWASPWLNLFAISGVLSPRPADWPDQHQLCGFFAPSGAGPVDELPPDLEGFLQAGEPPVYFSFGSMMPPSWEEQRETEQIWRSAVKRAGCRAIFQLPWETLGDFPSDTRLFKLNRCPHQLIFPRCSLVVHHGGAGTTQMSLLAQRPAVVVPHIADQFFWGAELERLGLGVRAQARNELTSEGLARSILDVLQAPSMFERAARIGSAMAKENGVAVAVRLIESRMAALRAT